MSKASFVLIASIKIEDIQSRTDLLLIFLQESKDTTLFWLF